MQVLEEQHLSNNVMLLRLIRTAQMNALNPDLIDALRAALARSADDGEIAAVIITGSDRAFCSGADLVSFLSRAAEDPGAVGRQVSRSMYTAFNPLMREVMDFPKPVVIAVNGMAAGGGAALALCGDVVIAGRSAKFKFVQVQQLGCVADLGANWLLQRIAGRAAALGAILLGDTISAERAERLGLVWDVVDDGELIDRASELAGRLAAVPAEAVIASRRLVDLSSTATFEDLLEHERLYQHELASSPTLAATVASFLDSRKGQATRSA
jgi:2-(1,2-epoxy-1,2-dihydrophenyl)acetyl-CoA isomerase